MCGLAFIYNSKLGKPELESRMQQSLENLAHRGPDEYGIQGNQYWIAGHRRLSIIDIASSKQPMSDPSGNFTLVYNGEIYNFQELHRKLNNNWNFLTHGDTEVVLAGLCLYGPDFLSQMQGMWAIAFWNNRQQKLLLARDRLGKKPLFYHNSQEQFACSSEIPALIHLIPERLIEDMDSTADYLRYGFYLPGTTAYQKIKEVLPGHYLEWQKDREICQHNYWKLSADNIPLNKQQAIESLRVNFTQAVEKRMVADVEIGAFLSGGIDSSLIVATMAGKLGVKPKTFTIGFTNASYDERQYANLVSKQYGTQHFERLLTEFDPDQLLNLILSHHGQPFGDASLLPTALVSQLAAEHVKVVLSGDGGDELFSGYQRYQARLIYNNYIKAPTFIKKLIEKAVGALPDPSAHHSRSILKKAKLFVNSVVMTSEQKQYIAPLTLSNREFCELAPELANCGYSAPEVPELRNRDDVMEMMLMDALVYLPQDILAKVDRASMAYSLETRAPFLDTNVVELAYALPRVCHRTGFSGKKLLKNAFDKDLPDTIWRRRKQGFAVPLADWFRHQLGEQLEKLLSTYHKDELPINTSVARRMLHEHKLAKKDYSMVLWSIFVYLMWKNLLK